MNLAYITTYEANNLNGFYNWSGTGYFIAEALKQQGFSLDYVGPLYEHFSTRLIAKFKRHYHQLFNRANYLRALDPITLRAYAEQIDRRLSQQPTEVVFSATATPVAYLECEQPIVFWSDATFQNLLNFYPEFSRLCQETIAHGHQLEKTILDKCRLAIYSSDWAAKTAIDYYEAEPTKVKVVPFGANIPISPEFKNVLPLIKSRPRDRCKLLFLGRDWVRKGGDFAIAVARQLNASGLPTELTLVGSTPPSPEGIHSGGSQGLGSGVSIRALSYISKSTEAGQQRISQLLAESHFLILPSRADCTPIVFCEANALGVPCLSRRVGGIPTIIRDGVNGRVFALDAEVREYTDYILGLFSVYDRYEDLALSAFREYQSRLNWFSAGQTVRGLLQAVV